MKRYYLILLALSLALLSCGCVREKTVSEESFSYLWRFSAADVSAKKQFQRKAFPFIICRIELNSSRMTASLERKCVMSPG